MRGGVRISLSDGRVIIEPEEHAVIVILPDQAEARDAEAAKAERQPTTIREMILSYARERKGPFTIRDVVNALGLSYTSVSTYLSHMVKEGLMRRVRQGVYVLAENR